MKPLRLSGHAVLRRREAQQRFDIVIGELDIERAIEQPEAMYPGHSGRTVVWRGPLRVTYAESPSEIVVVTITYDPSHQSKEA